jgi:hypothetical protein
MATVQPLEILTNVIEMKRRRVDNCFCVYRKPPDREPFLVELVDGLGPTIERANWHAERCPDEFWVYDPRGARIVHRTAQAVI